VLVQLEPEAQGGGRLAGGKTGRCPCLAAVTGRVGAWSWSDEGRAGSRPAPAAAAVPHAQATEKGRRGQEREELAAWTRDGRRGHALRPLDSGTGRAAAGG